MTKRTVTTTIRTDPKQWGTLKRYAIDNGISVSAALGALVNILLSSSTIQRRVAREAEK